MIALRTLIVLLLLGLSGSAVMAQCDDTLLDEPADKLGKFVYLRDFKARLKKGKKGKLAPQLTYSVILNKGTAYRFIMNSADGFNGTIVMDLFDRRGKLISSYNSSADKHYEVIDMLCKQTGVHQIALSFTEGQEGCGVVVLGFQQRSGSNVENYLK